MEFIPLDRYSRKSQKSSVKQDTEKNNELEKDETNKKVLRKIKPKPPGRVLQKKNIKNKYKETLTLKSKERVQKRKVVKEKEKNEEQNVEVDKSKCNENEAEVEDENEDEDEDEDEENEEQEHERASKEEAFKKKCKEMDEKKKNRLFVKLKKKIYSEAQIKELHPDIRDVIFPRKKNSRWCWAVFASEKRADEAIKQLIKNKNIFVSKPNPYEQVDKKRKEKMKTVLKKKEVKKKLQQMWMY